MLAAPGKGGCCREYSNGARGLLGGERKRASCGAAAVAVAVVAALVPLAAHGLKAAALLASKTPNSCSEEVVELLEQVES